MFRKLLSFFGIIIGTLLLALVVIAAFFEDQVGELFVRELNKSLKNDLRIQNVDLSLIKYFPEAGVTLEGVDLMDGHTLSNTFMKAQNVSLRFSSMSLLSGKYDIKTINVQDAAMLVLIDKQGRASYDIFKETNQRSSNSSEFQMALERASFKNVELIYIDENTQQEIAMNINRADLSGEFSNEKFKLKSTADIFSGFVKIEGDKYLVGKDISYDANIDTDLKNGLYRLQNVAVKVDKTNTFTVDGTIESKEKSTDYNLTINGKDCNLSSVLDVLPSRYAKPLGDFESTGTFFFESFIKGRYDAINTPLVNISFGLNDGKITSPRLDYALKGASFKASFDNGGNKPETGFFEMPKFTGVLHGEDIEMNLRATNLDDPDIRFGFKGNVPMDAVHQLFNVPSIEDGDGLFEIKELQISGKYKDMIDPYGIARVDAKADMNFNDFEIEMNKKSVTIKDGQMSLNDNKLSVKEVNITAPGTDLVVTGDFQNLIPVFFKDSINSKDAQLKFNAKLEGKSLDLDRLIDLVSTDLEEGDVPEAVYDSLKQNEVEQNEDFFALIDGKFEANIEKVNYRKINAKNLTGQLIFNNNTLKIRNVKVDAMRGNFTLRGDVIFDEAPDLTAKIYCDQIDAREFFRQSEDFGQDYLTYKNIRGKLDAKIKIDAKWDETGEFLDDKLSILSDVKLTNGELLGFKMLEDFSKYIKLQDLRRVRFTKINNQFALQNNTFFIPTMFIQSNALNLTFSGRHTVEHDMDYLIKVNGGQTLLNKFKKFNPSRKPLKAKKKGFINIYTHVSGSLDDYDFVYGKKNYNKVLDSGLERQYAKIRRTVKDQLSVDALYEPGELLDEGESDGSYKYLRKPQVTPAPSWEKNTTQKTNIPDEEYDPKLDKEIDFQ